MSLIKNENQKVRRRNKQITVFVGILIKGNKILMCLRDEPECPDAHLKWELPGGKCDFGETPEDALKREFIEETGIEIKVERLIPYVYTHYWEYEWGTQQTFVMCYLCSFVKIVSDVRDHKVKEIKWIPIDQLDKHNLLAGTAEIIDNINH